ncbi:hypothetical protein, variant 1 [Exophiala mesophila]|uniref:Probable E3 ubiquitin ligase complex SCF subunit sconB n=2 Tax=Exophiala mesophila TaxID=212818 RepID=A0A0D1X6V0_EXOME|nr:hypothetical protein, variant 1 [Exophiala mesophila]KIV97550.1 hypothetical protein, variant 1 [Exophiala mesophila]
MDEEEEVAHNASYEPQRSKRPHLHVYRPITNSSEDFTPLNEPSQSSQSAHPNALLGQLSFAPATQTTVVTTTTTTTTKFPPFAIPRPRHAHQLDRKNYPLAATPTPPSLRNIHFEIGGKPTVFREAADTTLELEQFQEERRSIRNAGGTLQTVQNFEPTRNLDDATFSSSTLLSRGSHQRPASPDSLADTDGHSTQAMSSPTLSQNDSGIRQGRRHDRGLISSFSRIQNNENTDPITPESSSRPQRSTRRAVTRDASATSRNRSTLLPSPNMEQVPTFQSRRSITPKPPSHQSPAAQESAGSSTEHLGHVQARTRSVSQEDPVPTPPIDDLVDPLPTRPGSRRALSSVPARLHVSESPSALDGSLPSPSLSPVTAAATLQNAGYFAAVDTETDTASQDDTQTYDAPSTYERPSSNSLIPGSKHIRPTPHQSYDHNHAFSRPSVADIPAMLDYFETIPDELKSYVMHQLLRRCPKPTLQIVADAVNPALKCDFISMLPSELAINIIKYLDLQSLCKGAQVCRKWRQMINGDERAWKELFDADGYTLPEGELQQAITDGWGWQDPSGADGHEQNIGASSNMKSEAEVDYLSPSTSLSGGITGLLRRSKRKAATLLSGRNKQAKRKDTDYDDSADVIPTDWMSQISTAEGPYNAANAAMLAVPDSNVGLSSLKGLHLYKSLYRRHHLIRRNWMFEDTKPQHLAFRAHDTHVVTCLQFDTDKILTGSDDNNINVYETKTGILKSILTGHEGGVWALQYEGNTLVSGSTDRSVRVWNIQEARETHVFRGHTSTVRCLQIVSPVKIGETTEGKPIMMPKQPLIITGSRDSTLRVWKLPRPGDPMFVQTDNEGEADDCPFFVRTLTGHQHSVRAIAAHADTLVSGSYDYTVRVWKISTGETIHRLQGHTQKVYSVVLDHARNRCISGSMDNMVRIWDLNTGSMKYTLEGHTSLVGLLDLNCDKLVSAAADSTLRIWDPENGQCKATLSAHTGAITCFKHDGQKVISGSDRALKLWNIKTGECVKDLLSDLSGVWQVKFNERRCVAAVQRDGLTYIEVLDFGAARDGVPEHNRGRRIVVDVDGVETSNDDGGYLDLDGSTDPQ